MITYEEIKTWFSEKENKKILLSVFFGISMFLVGYGVGNYSKQDRQNMIKSQSNYTTTANKKPVDTKPPAETKQPVAATSKKTQTIGCLIKGNISANGKKIYHVSGGMFYKKVKAEMCFNTEAEAEAAGFIKSAR